MYVVMLTVVEEEGVPLVNMQLVVSIIPVDHKSYRIEATVWHENLTVIKFYGLSELLH